MIPRIAKRGRSFKSAGKYYLHDKNATTSHRIAWTHTINTPALDPRKALNWMAYTAMNAEALKHCMGIAKTGRKSKAGAVYSYSLSWHPEQQPDKETMLEAAKDTLRLLNLGQHEAIIIAHTDTDHAHVHIIANLVHPETGKTTSMSNDKLILSKWAEYFEREGSKIYCEQRVINNQKRQLKRAIKNRQHKIEPPTLH